MKTKQDLLNFMTATMACDEATDWVVACNTETAQQVWEACERPDWMLWLAQRNGVSQKTLVQLACVFARSVVHLVPAGEMRPLRCIETTEAWLCGEATIEQVRVARRDAAYYAATAASAAYYAATAAADAAYAADAVYAAYAADAATTAVDAAYAAARQSIRVEIYKEFCIVIRKAIPLIPNGNNT